MMQPTYPELLLVVVFEDDGRYVAVCLNRYLMTIARDSELIEGAVRDLILAHVEANREMGRCPFEGLFDAPTKYWSLWIEGARDGAGTFLIETPDTDVPTIEVRIVT